MTINDNYEERSINTANAVGQCVNQIEMNENQDFFSPVENEMVNHPQHYQAGGLECINVMEKVFGREAVESWIKLTIFKYAWRTDKKDGAQDIDKIRWYSEKLVTMLKEDGEYL